MTPHTERYTFRPGQVPSDPAAYRRAQQLEDIGQRTRDLFTRSDNTDADLDGRHGSVLLRDFAAPGLLEPVTSTVSGRLSAEGELKVVGQNRPGQPSSALSVTGDGLLLDRPAYVNHHLLPSLEGWRREDDGTQYLSVEYYELRKTQSPAGGEASTTVSGNRP